jgi:hypothetical protein
MAFSQRQELENMKIVGNAWLKMLAGGVFLTALVGCGDDAAKTTETDTGSDTTADTDTTDTGTTDTAPDTIEVDTTDTGGGIACTRTVDCETQLGVGFICESGVCVEQLLPDPCTADGQECTDPATQQTAEFVCVQDAAGAPAVCRQLCDSGTADATGSQDCPLNTFCFDVGATSDSGLTGACTPGDCATNIFDETACGGTGTCFAVGHGASFCVTAGTAIEGEACGLDTTGTPPDSDICAPGLLCSNSVCISPCDRTNGNADCTDGLNCLAAFDYTPRNRPGLCGTACDAFSVGQCPTDETCQPFLGRAGVNIWGCVANTGTTTFGPDEICDSTGSCEEGYLCVGTGETDAGGNNISRCSQLCDTDAEIAGESPCGSAGAGPALIPSIAFGAASGFLSFPAGSYDVQVRDVASGSLVTDLAVAVVAGEVHTELATLNAAGEFTRFTYVDLRAGETLPANGVRLIHAASNAPDVDVYVATALGTLASGDSSGAIEAAAGSYNLWQASTAGAFTLTAGQANDVFFFNGNTAAASYVAAAPVTGALVRLVHGSAVGNVDVYADCATNFAGCTPANLVAGAFTFGGVSAYRTVAAGPHTFYLAAAGADPATASALLTVGPIALAEGGRYTAVANDIGGTNVALLSDSTAALTAGTASIRLHNFSSADVSSALESTSPVAAGVAFGEAVEGATSAYVALPAGNYLAVLRGAGALSSADAAFIAPFTVDGLLTAIVADDGAGLTAIAIRDSIAAPAAGQGSVRVIHAADGVGAVSINLPGTTNSVCARSAVTGIGFCQESCQPFPRDPGSDYGCTTAGDSCFPVLLTETAAAAPVGICDANDGTIAPFEACTNDGTIGECADFGVCLDFSDDGAANPNCNPLCAPYSQTDVCGAGATCSVVLPLVNTTGFGLCTQDFTAGSIGGRCDTAKNGFPCEADGTLCLDTGAGPTCVLACREGFDDCANDPGTTCNAGLFTGLPAFVGVCL